jgi:DNA-binding transcriptional regulator YiaG
MKGQEKKLRDAREALNVTTEELAEQLGKSLSTLRSWLLPPGNKARREMPKSAELLLERILADRKKK